MNVTVAAAFDSHVLLPAVSTNDIFGDVRRSDEKRKRGLVQKKRHFSELVDKPNRHARSLSATNCKT